MRHDLISYVLSMGRQYYDRVVLTPEIINEVDLMDIPEGYIYYGLLEIIDGLKTI
jgi:hypothetical protein